jgi:hypothetical protein
MIQPIPESGIFLCPPDTRYYSSFENCFDFCCTVGRSRLMINIEARPIVLPALHLMERPFNTSYANAFYSIQSTWRTSNYFQFYIYWYRRHYHFNFRVWYVHPHQCFANGSIYRKTLSPSHRQPRQFKGCPIKRLLPFMLFLNIFHRQLYSLLWASFFRTLKKTSKEFLR